MNWTMRDTRPGDYPAIATLLTTTRQMPITVERVERMATMPADLRQSRLAVQNGEIIGGCWIQQTKNDGAGKFFLHIDVHPSAQRQGLGSALYADALAFAQANGLASLYSYVYESRPGGLPFAHKHGFTITRTAKHSQLDLATFDDTPFVSYLTRNKLQGIRFHTLAGLGDTLENRRKLYELNKQCSADIPGRGKFFTFENYCKVRFNSPFYRPEGVIVALHNDAWVGLTAVTYHPAGNFCFNEMTGVLRAYRGRGIAKALKLVGIRFAHTIGAATVRTFNDADNHGILAVNRQLGYQPLPDSHTMTATFEM